MSQVFYLSVIFNLKRIKNNIGREHPRRMVYRIENIAVPPSHLPQGIEIIHSSPLETMMRIAASSGIE
ncbi:hypothetical protein, partial [Sulfuricurvum sp.]|uniref:hypothetical protein n=1 Tax=Sulfuricurvum sp. TaxID=2025608 RepID=UPI0025D6AA33